MRTCFSCYLNIELKCICQLLLSVSSSLTSSLELKEQQRQWRTSITVVHSCLALYVNTITSLSPVYRHQSFIYKVKETNQQTYSWPIILFVAIFCHVYNVTVLKVSIKHVQIIIHVFVMSESFSEARVQALDPISSVVCLFVCLFFWLCGSAHLLEAKHTYRIKLVSLANVNEWTHSCQTVSLSSIESM